MNYHILITDILLNAQKQTQNVSRQTVIKMEDTSGIKMQMCFGGKADSGLNLTWTNADLTPFNNYG